MTKKTKRRTLILLSAVILTLALSLVAGQVSALAGNASNQTGQYQYMKGYGAAW